jgi:ankyrin repeat protein
MKSLVIIILLLFVIVGQLWSISFFNPKIDFKTVTPEQIMSMLKAGADANEQNIYGFTPLMSACIDSPDTSVVLTLLRAGAKVNYANPDYYTPLDCAVVNPNPEIVKLLIRNKANVKIKDRKGFTPLMLAVSGNHQSPGGSWSQPQSQ